MIADIPRTGRSCQLTNRLCLIVLLAIVLMSIGLPAAAQAQRDVIPPTIRMGFPMTPRGISGGGAVNGTCQATVFFEATVTDNCCIQTEGVVVTVVQTPSVATLSDLVIVKTHTVQSEGQTVFVEGSVVVSALTACPAVVVVSVTATDCEGNVSGPVTWSTEVTDTTPPVISCPGDISRTGCPATVDRGLATASDNCDPSPTVVGTRSDGLALTDPYPCGTTTITWTATDHCGNEAVCEQLIQLSAPPPPSGGGGGGGGTTSYNSAPEPSAGRDQVVCLGERVCLDASASFDRDVDRPENTFFDSYGNPLPPQKREDLKFEWTFAIHHYLNGEPVYHHPVGSRVMETLEGFDTEYPCFTPDMLGEYVLNLRVTDDEGESQIDQVSITVRECGETYGCSYPAGWNLLSVPVQPLDPRAETILGGTSAQGIAFTFANGYQEVEDLTPLAGYWVHFVNPEMVSVLGREIRDDVTLRLDQAGWHLISSPFTIDWERVLVYVNDVERHVGESVARDVIENTCACYDPVVKIYRVASQLLPCQGYWVRTLEPDVVLKLKWTTYSASYPPAQGGCSGTPTSNAPPPPSQAQSPSPQSTILAYPNPIRHSTAHFRLSGFFEAEAIRVQVYDASGRHVWTGEAQGRMLDWEPQTDDGEPLAWGPYIYCIDAKVSAHWTRVDCGILFIAEVD